VNDAPWRIELTRAVQRDLRRLDPLANSALRKLTGSSQSRLRVGDWRVRLTLDNRARVLLVMRILPRGRAYRD
jgi:mRNA-degrading endonuclease RelE of RelBE toxin-antitoxin system